MALSESIDTRTWPLLHGRLDAAIADAASRYLDQFVSRPFGLESRQWSRELDELRLKREPDYTMPGVPLVYALRYMARRVISVVGAYRLLKSQATPPAVLDIGSGTGATALAFDLLHPASRVSVVGIEPSGEMRNLAESLRLRSTVSARYREGAVTELIVNPTLVRACDLLVFSACFPYGFDRWEEIGAALGDYRGVDSMAVLAIEPDAKSEALDALQRVLRGRGWPTVVASSRDLPTFMINGELPLNQLIRVWRRAGSPGGRIPASWWSPPDDRYLIANPAPAWHLRSRPAAAHLAAHEFISG